MIVNRSVGKRAIVLGAGMGGLAAAAALSDFFEQVIVLERDALPEKPAHRSGAPQGRHVHGLLMGGQNALEELLPGFRDELAGGGDPTSGGGACCCSATAPPPPHAATTSIATSPTVPLRMRGVSIRCQSDAMVHRRFYET